MKNNFKEQFRSIQSIIKTNASTIKDLIKQSEKLEEIINELSNTPGNTEIKNSLEELKGKISESIETLIKQTQNLFEAYEKLIEEIFGNK